MKSKILSLFIVTLILAVATTGVSAWHCVDSDEQQPQGPPYGQWGDNGVLGGETWGWYDVGVDLPSGCTITGNYQAECADTCEGLTFREFLCEDRPNYPGETVITWHDYPESEQCSNEVPEFSAVAGIVAVAGVAGVVALRRKLK